jgi:predicted metal-dependent phosphotriesterase family hydrolase
MTKVNTVLGQIPPDGPGLTLSHEHLALGYLGWQCDALAPSYDREADATICAEALKEARLLPILAGSSFRDA